MADRPLEHLTDGSKLRVRPQQRGQVAGDGEAGPSQGVVPMHAAGLQPTDERGLDIDKLTRNDVGEAEPVAEGRPPGGYFHGDLGCFPWVRMRGRAGGTGAVRAGVRASGRAGGGATGRGRARDHPRAPSRPRTRPRTRRAQPASASREFSNLIPPSVVTRSNWSEGTAGTWIGGRPTVKSSSSEVAT